MAILPIIKYPDPILEEKTKKIIQPQDLEIKRLALDMLETLDKNKGLGLAAPQVGVAVRLCVIKFNGKNYILINPQFKSKSWSKIITEEGCLSFPGQFLTVKRHKKVTVKALDRNGKEFIIKAEGLLSRALQHEIDHLDGILFIKRKIRSKEIKK